MNYDICAVLDRSDKVRCTECVIDNERDTCIVSDLCESLDIRNVRRRVAQCLNVESLCIRSDGSLYFVEIMDVDECCLDTLKRKCVCKKVLGTAVDGLLSYDVLSLNCEAKDSVCDS